jgi:site-specific recombinase XerC
MRARLPGYRTGISRVETSTEDGHQSKLQVLASIESTSPCHRQWRAFEGRCLSRRVFNKHAQRVADRRLAARNVATIVKAAAAKLGLEAASFAGHSLRAGFVTSAVKRGANLIKITDVTGHRSLEMLKTYSRDAEAFVGHAGAGLL